MGRRLDLTIVLPTYNERRNIQALMPLLEKEVGKAGLAAEILVVDDSSPDGTADVARKLNRKYGNVRVLSRPRREGLGAALRDGYDGARGDIILSMDSDLSIAPADIHKILRKMGEGYDLVVGSRHTKGAGYESRNLKTRLKRFVSTYGNAFTNALLKLPIRDYSMNFRAVRRSVWKKIRTHEKRNAFLLEMIVEVWRLGGRIGEVPFEFRDRIHGKSKMRVFSEAIPFLVKVIKYSLIKKTN